MQKLNSSWRCSNQFLNQEPGSNAAIKDFAKQKGFSGLLMDKINVNGSDASPVYTYLKVPLLDHESNAALSVFVIVMGTLASSLRHQAGYFAAGVKIACKA